MSVFFIFFITFCVFGSCFGTLAVILVSYLFYIFLNIFYLGNIQSNDGRSEIRSIYFIVGKQSVVGQQLEYVLPG